MSDVVSTDRQIYTELVYACIAYLGLTFVCLLNPYDGSKSLCK